MTASNAPCAGGNWYSLCEMRRLLLLGFLTVAALVPVFADGAPEWSQTLRFDGSFQREWALDEGSAFELSVRIDEPSALPPNARIGVAWTGPAIPQPEFEGERSDPGVAAAADWQKTLHALDPDVYLVYRTPLSGEYSLRLETVTDRPQLLGDIPHDTGLAPLTTPLPTRTPPVRDVALTIEMRPLERLSAGGTVIEAEPNNAPEQAVDLPFRSGDEDQIVYVPGGADVPVIGLPGNPVSALVCFFLFCRPLIQRLMGAHPADMPRVRAVLDGEVVNHDSREVYARVVLSRIHGELHAKPLTNQSSGALKSLAHADGLAICPADVPQLNPGERVEVAIPMLPSAAAELLQS